MTERLSLGLKWKTPPDAPSRARNRPLPLPWDMAQFKDTLIQLFGKAWDIATRWLPFRGPGTPAPATVPPQAVDVYIWGWSVDYRSVGHAMVTAANSQTALLSQFPHAAGQRSVMRGPNVLMSYPDTFGDENRPPSVVFRVTLPKPADFAGMVDNHLKRPTWYFDPAAPDETHCARSSYEALRAGGVALDPNGKYVVADGERKQILPNTLWALLHVTPGIQTIQQSEENLLEEVRLAYEQNLKGNWPFETWYAAIREA